MRDEYRMRYIGDEGGEIKGEDIDRERSGGRAREGDIDIEDGERGREITRGR